MFSIFPRLFRTNKARVHKAESTDILDRPNHKSEKLQIKGSYAHLFKQEKGKKGNPLSPVSPLSPNAHAIRMRGIG